jgi:hypothetical protein
MSDKKWENPSTENHGDRDEKDNGCWGGTGTGHGCANGTDPKVNVTKSFVSPELNQQVKATADNGCNKGGGTTNTCSHGGGTKNDCSVGSD